MVFIKKEPYLNNMSVRISQIPPLDLKFNDSVLTEYELLVATIEKLNEIVDLTNLTLKEWYELKEWIQQELGSYAIEILQQMLVNGELMVDVNYTDEDESLSFVFTNNG